MDFLITSEISVWDLPPWWLHRKEASCSVGELGSVPGSGRFPGGEHGNPLQYFCLENPLDKGAWRAIVQGVTKSQTWLKWLSMHACTSGTHPVQGCGSLVQTLLTLLGSQGSTPSVFCIFIGLFRVHSPWIHPFLIVLVTNIHLTWKHFQYF